MISPCEKTHFCEMFSVTDAIEMQFYEKKNVKFKVDLSICLYSSVTTGGHWEVAKDTRQREKDIY